MNEQGAAVAAGADTQSAQWRAAVEKVLKGADFERVMVGKTIDGLRIEPLLPRRKAAPALWGARGVQPWAVVARAEDPDAARANALVHEDLLGGADSLALIFAGARAARGFGLAPEALESVLRDVRLDMLHLRLELPETGFAPALEALRAHIRQQAYAPEALKIDFGLPITAQGLAAAKTLREQRFVGPFFRADGRPWHNAGASEALELAATLSEAVAALRAGAAPEAIAFALCADDDLFLSLAKVRALRVLWAQVQQAAELPRLPGMIHVETSFRMLTRADCYTNLLRGTLAAFAAGVGGAESLDVLPFTAALGLPDSHARRLARNTSLILCAESNLHRVIDPAAGAGELEALTDTLAVKAWESFQKVEAAGGVEGHGRAFLLDRLQEHRLARQALVAVRKIPITGVSEFPAAQEAAEAVLIPAPLAAPGAPDPLAPHRLAEPFEALRARADALAPRPRVFLANLGQVSDFSARSTFAKNFFEVGGLEVLSNDGFADSQGATDLAALSAAFSASGARFACLCGPDALYYGAETPASEAMAGEAFAAAQHLLRAGAKTLLLAGKPGPHEAALKQAGVNVFIAAGGPIIDPLSDLLAACEKGE